MRLLMVLMLAVATLALAGCAGTGDGPAVASAQDAQAPADKSAHHWAEDAQLVSATGVELDDVARAEFQEDIEELRDEVDDARAQGGVPQEALDAVQEVLLLMDIVADTPDADIGDGMASLWIFGYAAESHPEETFSVAVARGAVVLARADGDAFDEFDEGDSGDALGAYGVDSTQAAEAAAKDSADFAALREQSNVAATYLLTADDDTAVWFLGIEAQGETLGMDEAWVAVDANTGSIMKDLEDVIPIDDEILQQEADTGAAAFTLAASTSITQTFDVQQDGHAILAFEARFSPAPLQGGLVTITDPAGNITELTLAPGQTALDARTQGTLAPAPAGTYKVRLDVTLTAYSQVRYSWCTDGLPTGQDAQDLRACALVAQAQGGNDLGETLSRFHRWADAWL